MALAPRIDGMRVLAYDITDDAFEKLIAFVTIRKEWLRVGQFERIVILCSTDVMSDAVALNLQGQNIPCVLFTVRLCKDDEKAVTPLWKSFQQGEFVVAVMNSSVFEYAGLGIPKNIIFFDPSNADRFADLIKTFRTLRLRREDLMTVDVLVTIHKTPELLELVAREIGNTRGNPPQWLENAIQQTAHLRAVVEQPHEPRTIYEL